MTSSQSTVFTWDKGVNVQLSNHFTSKEFECPCGCIRQQISKKLIKNLEKLRVSFGSPIIVTSGYRCASYQARLRSSGLQTAVNRSQHELGRAADLAATQDDLMPYLLIHCAWHFKAVGDGTRIAEPFVHVDERRSRPRLWVYGEKEKGQG